MAVRLSLISVAVLALAACGQAEQEPAAEGPVAASETASETAPVSATPATIFDLSTVPLSTAPLAARPYFTAPAGYRIEDQGDIAATEFPIWLGDGFRTVEGDVHWTRLSAEAGHGYSRLEVGRALEAQVLAAGGVRIASSAAPQATVDALPEAMRQELLPALGDNSNSPTTTYVIRREDKTVWVHVVVSIEVAYLSTVDAPPFVAPPAS